MTQVADESECPEDQIAALVRDLRSCLTRRYHGTWSGSGLTGPARGLHECVSGQVSPVTERCVSLRPGVTELVRVDLVKVGKMEVVALSGSQFTAETCA